MTIKLTIEISEKEMQGYLTDNPGKSIKDLQGEINNVIYLGGDCINAMMERLLGFGCDTYIEKNKVSSKYTIDDLFLSINDVYAQFDDGKIDHSQTVEIFLNCCNQFIKDHTEVKQ
jgi:hypothetical protein